MLHARSHADIHTWPRNTRHRSITHSLHSLQTANMTLDEMLDLKSVLVVFNKTLAINRNSRCWWIFETVVNCVRWCTAILVPPRGRCTVPGTAVSARYDTGTTSPLTWCALPLDYIIIKIKIHSS